jgi:DNA-binding CsgD family transcriptional regulator
MEDLAARVEKLKQLRPQQREVFQLKCEGYTHEAIARALVIAPATVEYHIAELYTKLGIRHLPRSARLQELGRFCPALSYLPEEAASLPSGKTDPDPQPPPEDLLLIVREDALALLHPDERYPAPRRPLTPGWPLPPTPEEEGRGGFTRRNPWLAALIGGLVVAVVLGGLFLLFGRGQGGPVYIVITPEATLPSSTTLLSAPTVEPTRLQPATVEPTPTRTATPQATRTPVAPTPPPETEPGTVLAVGQAWRQSGLELTMRYARLLPDTSAGAGVGTQFDLVSEKAQPFEFLFSQDNFTATDNLGRSSKPVPLDTIGNRTYPMEQQVASLRPGEKLEAIGSGRNSHLFFPVNIRSAAVNEIIITVSMGGITDARWRIPVSR